MDGATVDRRPYLLEQWFRYEYANPVLRLRHRLVVVPPALYGSQRRLDHGLTVSGAEVRVSESSDDFGNHILGLDAPSVTAWIEFEVWALMSYRSSGAATPLPYEAINDSQLLASTTLTRANSAVVDAGRELLGASSGEIDLAERICTWTHQAMTYEQGTTGVHTTAAEALEGGRGVCQDYAHLMLAVCRSVGLRCRYVSGHLIGEGGSHAWVEVVMANPSDPVGRPTVAVAFDPTHERRAERGYFTVAIGRDYADVAPTAGTFEGRTRGVLTTRKRLALADPW
jgi:transglutaminase-like putative cysteine protease